MAQLVEHILGTDEVPSSNLGSSSRQPRGYDLGALAFYRGISSLELVPCSSWGVARLKSFATGSHWLPTVQIWGKDNSLTWYAPYM